MGSAAAKNKQQLLMTTLLGCVWIASDHVVRLFARHNDHLMIWGSKHAFLGSHSKQTITLTPLSNIGIPFNYDKWLDQRRIAIFLTTNILKIELDFMKWGVHKQEYQSCLLQVITKKA
jgi:hypothetical protein